jgi:hypothetical protein
MRILLFVLTFGFVIASSAQVEAAVSKKKSVVKKHKISKSVKKKTVGKKKGAVSSDAHLQTNVNFEDHGVTGEYQMPDEALARVENEKSLTDLLGARKHFKDRLITVSEQE